MHMYIWDIGWGWGLRIECNDGSKLVSVLGTKLVGFTSASATAVPDFQYNFVWFVLNFDGVNFIAPQRHAPDRGGERGLGKRVLDQVAPLSSRHCSGELGCKDSRLCTGGKSS